MFVIVSAGRFDCAGAHVLASGSNEIARFETRKEAREYRDEVVPMTPSKYMPLVVREED